MTNLKSLFEKEEYKLICDLTKDATDCESLFYYANSLIQLGKYKEAMEVVSKNIKTLWTYSPIKCIDLNFGLRFTLNQFDDAYKDYEMFVNFQYVSQTVEEKLRDLKALIRNTEIATYRQDKTLDESSIKNSLLSESDSYRLLSLLDYVKNHNINNFIDGLVKICSSDKIHDYAKTYSLLLLVSANYNKEISLKKGDENLNLVPASLDHPFESKEFFNLKNIANEKCKNISVLQLFDSVLGSYQMSIYPQLVEKQNPNLVASAVLSICSLYLNDQIPNIELLDSTFTIDELNKKISEIEELQSKIPPLKF